MSGHTALRFLGVSNLLEREYRNAPAYQWARELVRNGIEAEARAIEFGVEWEGVKARRVYRLQYADDGLGMSHDDLRDYMRTLGKGSKTVGGPHDNYAMGCRMTLLPWNPMGVVVISQQEGEEPFMVKLMFDPQAADGAGEYVLEEVEWEDDEGSYRSTVYPPYLDEDLGINWAFAIPKVMADAGHGTTFILLGRNDTDDTFEGDPERRESIRTLSRKYFNTRFWELPATVSLRCIEFMNPDDRSMWPGSPNDLSKLYRHRSVKGAKEVVEYVTRESGSTVLSNGTVTLPDDLTKAHWWLRRPEPVQTGGVGTNSGFIAVMYRSELYGHAYANLEDGDSKAGATVYRACGIGSDAVRKRVFVIFEPPEYIDDAGQRGVAPSTGRADLYWMGAGLSPRSVKPSDWAEAFANNMPEEIQLALSADHEENKVTDEERGERLKRVMDRLSKRWRVSRARVVTPETADTTTNPLSPGGVTRQPPDVPPPHRPRRPRKRVVVRRHRQGESTVGKVGIGDVPAKTTKVYLGYPDYEWVKEEDIAETGMLAAWQPPSKTHPNGLVQLDETHPVVAGQVGYWQSQYPAAVALKVQDIVKEAYADVAVAKVSHIHALTSDAVLSEEQCSQMLQNPALTASLVGLLGEDALISPRLGGLGAKRKRDEVESDAGKATPAKEPATA